AKGDLFITLLRAVGDLSRGDLPTRPGHAAWPTPIPDAQCLGTSRIEMALVPVTVADLERGDFLPQLWEDAFLPITGLWLRDAAGLTPALVDIALEGTGLVFSTLKPAQIGSPMVLRCYNATNRKAAGVWRFPEHVLPPEARGCCVVAPEGRPRFYLTESPTERRVGASWMTREDRLHEIDDYVRYLDAVHVDLKLPNTRITALGFSQGSA